ncbi:TPA: acetyltransferase [Streptococcus suis]|uniref:Acetyltransferase n=1 Tax=Streptococcus suis TaxID=1307 RepID=A0A4T2GME8_STRSU|nr:acetyltransferase [Streptococcus suis]MBM7268947.1 acetyltransferase [Streptococcus suis]MBM7269339.1 acetyltransferase [Streptococcus suis]MBM7314085.1 acetyltransferase [Streptococcus suis]TII00118.1 acetyltransferase [Streptococcus suis]
MEVKNKQLFIIGASGHGKVVAEIASLNGYQEIYFLDDFSKECHLGPWSIVGTSQYPIPSDAAVFVAIGDNKIRSKIVHRFKDWEQPSLIHPRAIVSPTVSLGKSCVVMANAVLQPDVKLGDGCIVNTAASIDHDCKLGDFVHISPGSHLAGGVTVGQQTWIGIGSSVIQSLSICKDVIVGAGGVVIQSITSSGTYVGNPCRKIQ